MADQVAALDARALTVAYGRRRHRGVTDVDLRVEPGQAVGLVGANGAGKTTFMRTLLDFVRPTSGVLEVFGLDTVQDSVEVRRRTTYLPGDLVLPPRLTGHEIVRRFAFARARADLERVPVLAERLQLDLSRRAGDLSKGNKQKLGLVLAFAPRVDLLVLDEPTSGLDPLLQREFAAMVSEVVRAGATVLLSSHVMSEVEHISSRVALLREGRLAAYDDMQAIRSRARRRGLVRPEAVADVDRIAAALRGLPGVQDVSAQPGGVAFASTGSVDAVVKCLARFQLSSLDLAHADLEDAFFFAAGEPVATPEPS